MYRRIEVRIGGEVNYPPPSLGKMPQEGCRIPGEEVPDSINVRRGTMSLFTLVRPSASFSTPGNQCALSSRPLSGECWVAEKWRIGNFSKMGFLFLR